VRPGSSEIRPSSVESVERRTGPRRPPRSVSAVPSTASPEPSRFGAASPSSARPVVSFAARRGGEGGRRFAGGLSPSRAIPRRTDRQKSGPNPPRARQGSAGAGVGAPRSCTASSAGDGVAFAFGHRGAGERGRRGRLRGVLSHDALTCQAP